jgi:hypothetical protein
VRLVISGMMAAVESQSTASRFLVDFRSPPSIGPEVGPKSTDSTQNLRISPPGRSCDAAWSGAWR